LNYTYNANSNKILKVDDLSNETASFKDVSGIDYTYWADGSLKSDANKGITLIEYNYLKRPKKYTFSNGSTLENQYDATGKKLKSISSDGTIYDFVGNLIYKNNVLYQISHDEGRVIKGEYEYEIKDHLGNLRVAFKDSLGIAKITQKQDYDVYGSELQGLSYTKPLWNQDNFKFLGRESIAQTGYVDLLNRQYDKILGRFTSPDPVTDGQESQSLFQYSWNNPVLLSDPNGNYPGEGLWKKFKNYIKSLEINVEANASIGLQANAKIGVAKIEANAYSVQLGKVSIAKSSDGKVNASAQVQFWSGKNEDIGGSKSKWEDSNKEKVESKQSIGLSVGLKNKLELGASWERTENNDRNGNKSDAKQKGSIGLTGDLTKGLPIKTGYETENMENGSKSPPTNSTLSFSFGGALIIGGEVKVEIKTKN